MPDVFDPFSHGESRPGPLTRGAPPTAVLGPTNTGKTHYAIERMLAHASGMIGLPLRLLAREVYDRVAAQRGPREVALVTGEEKIVPPSPRYWVCTVEAMPLDRTVDFVAVDEIQLAADRERGRVFTARLLHARGAAETLLLGSQTMRPILRRLYPDMRFVSRERFSTLSYAGPKKVTRLPRRSAVVGFSAETVYAAAELIRRQRGGAAVILGALSPRTRNAQAELYQSGEVDYLVATDAIGMGLNMDIDHVAFAATRKFDGRTTRGLRADELAQIAGRAGRHMRDGTFGVTGQCPTFDETTIAAIEEHAFEPVAALQWRSEALDFSSIDALARSLDRPPPRIEFTRAPPGDDEIAFHRLIAHSEIREAARGGASLALLWSVCETPDFRKISPEAHARLLREIYLQLLREGVISDDWLGPRVERLDRTDGDIDAISARIAHVRTWTYLSHRAAWLKNAAYWQERARAIEDSLSDALHEKLTQRFVDRRTSALLKRLHDDAPLLAGVTDDGEVIVEGHFVGRLMGFEFIVDPRARGLDAKRVNAAAERALAPVLAARAAALANASTDELSLREDGVIWWRSAPVARLEKGPTPLRPNLVLKGAGRLSPHLRGRIQDRLQDFFASRIEALLGDLIRLQQAASSTEEGGLAPLTRGVAFRLVENFGAMARAQFGDDLKQLDQNERAKLRRLGVRFGEYTLFMPNLLKPAPARLLTLLWSLWTDRNPADFPPPKAGLVSLPVEKDLPYAYYYASGYRPSGARAVRIDMLERLAGAVRAARRDEYRGGFEPTTQMMSFVGCSGEDFESILVSLGYRKQTMKVLRPVAQQPAPSSEPAGDAARAPDGDAENAAGQPTPVETAGEVSRESDAKPVPQSLTVTADANEPAAPSPEPAVGEQAAAPEQTPASSEPVETREIEIAIWRMAPRRPPNKKGGRAHRQDDRRADARRDGQSGQRQRADGRFDGKKPPKGAPSRNGPPRHAPGMPVRRRTADPNSPFAVLAGLKEELVRQRAPADGGKPDKPQ